ncbi:ATP-binding cassette domain-containing protein [Streptococcus suis]|uniref:ATP-binding cassette domain-containing protein n=2 Tax=Streptococcus suis TaxID=1307 RepID=UPI000CF5A35A|nr:ABC transporter ATP-binding protein [Streptococcus suis]
MKKIIYQLKPVIALQLVFHILYSFTNVVLPELNKYLFDHIFQMGWTGLVWLLLAYALTIIANSVFQYISQVYEWKVSQGFYVTAKKGLANSLLSQPLAKFSEKNISAYLSIFDNDLETIEESYLSPLMDIIRSSLSMLIYAVSLFLFVHPLVAVGIILSSALAVFIPKWITGPLSQRQRAFLQSLESYFQVVTDLFSAKNRVNSETFGSISRVHHRSVEESEQARFRFGQFKTLANVVNGFSMFLVQLTAFGLVGYLLLQKELTIGAAIATFSYVENFIYPMKYILLDVNYIHSTKETVANLEDYFAGQVLSEQVPSYPNVTALEVREVAYRVGELAVADFSYRFDKGKKYAIIGPSASGKSTFLRVLAGELALDKGSVSYLENDVLHEMEAATAFYLSQFEHLYHTDFENNVSVFGTYEKGRDVMHGLLRSLPTSLQDTLMTASNPSLLSGGEKNVLCLLRALMSGKEILLLDEPTAHLDSALTKQVLTNLLQLEDKLIITILHESDSAILDMFDVVLEMRDGKLREKI